MRSRCVRRTSEHVALALGDMAPLAAAHSKCMMMGTDRAQLAEDMAELSASRTEEVLNALL